MKLTKLQAIGIKTEATQGTPVVPASATDYLVVENVDVNIVPEVLTRDFRRTSLDNLAHVIGKRSVVIKFQTELKGSGTAGTLYAPLDAAILACGFAATNVPATSQTYAPTSAPASASFVTPGKSCTIEVYKGGTGTNNSLKYIVAGCCGNMKIMSVSGHYAKVEFEFKGTYTAITDATMPSPTYISQLPAIWASSTISVMGTALVIAKWDIDCGNVITMRDDAGSANSVKGFVLTDRDPKGSVDVEAESVSTHDFYAKLIASTEASSSFTLGATAGNITTITLPKGQYQDVQVADRGNIQTFNIPMNYDQNTGDDWVSIAFT